MPDDARNDLAEALADVELTPEDGTLVLDAIVDNAFRILPVCPPEEEDQSRIIDRVLDELLEVETVDDLVKSRVRYVQKIREILAASRQDIEPSGDGPLESRAREIATAAKGAVGIEAKIVTLRRLRRGDQFGNGDGPGTLDRDQDDAVTDAAIRVAIAMLDRGRRRFLWQNHSFYRATEDEDGITPMAGERQPVLEEIAGSMIDGAVGGAIGGARVGSIGGLKGVAATAAAGAIAGGVGSGAITATRRFRGWVSRRMN